MGTSVSVAKYMKAPTIDAKKFEKTDLNEILSYSLAELSQNIEDKKATISYTELPVINGIPFQMQQLFSTALPATTPPSGSRPRH